MTRVSHIGYHFFVSEQFSHIGCKIWFSIRISHVGCQQFALNRVRKLHMRGRHIICFTAWTYNCVFYFRNIFTYLMTSTCSQDCWAFQILDVNVLFLNVFHMFDVNVSFLCLDIIEMKIRILHRNVFHILDDSLWPHAGGCPN